MVFLRSLILFVSVLLVSCGSKNTIHEECIPSTSLTPTEEAVIFLYRYNEVVSYSTFDINEGEYYVCVDDQHGKGRSDFCEGLLQIPLSEKLKLDGLMIDHKHTDIASGYEAKYFRGLIDEKIVWISGWQLASFQGDEMPIESNLKALENIGFVEKIYDASINYSRLEIPDDWQCLSK